MIKLKYIGEKTLHDVNFSTEKGVVQISGTLQAKAKGFEIYRSDGVTMLGDYSQYRTIHRVSADGVEFTNDGSVYPVTPGLSDLKKERIAYTKVKLAEFLEENPLESIVRRQGGLYAVTEEKQALMISNYMTYQIEKQVNPSAKLTWNETGKMCEEWSEQEFLQLILEIKSYVYPLVSYQQFLEVQIVDCVTESELHDIVVDYGKAVTNETVT